MNKIVQLLWQFMHKLVFITMASGILRQPSSHDTRFFQGGFFMALVLYERIYYL